MGLWAEFWEPLSKQDVNGRQKMSHCPVLQAWGSSGSPSWS